MPSTLSDGLLDQIYQRLDPRRLFHKLELAERGRRFVGRCPQCGRPELYVLRYDPRYPGLRARCNRLNHCGFSISAWDYLREIEGVREEEIFRTLAERAGVDLRSCRGAPADVAQAVRRRERRAALHECFWNWAAARLWSEACHAASEEARTAAFLLARGYTEALCQAMGLAFLPPPAQTRAHLLEHAGFSEEELRGAPFLDPAFEARNPAGLRLYTVAIAYAERQSLVARTALPKAELPPDAPKYRYPRGLRLDSPAGLRAVDRRRPVIVVEGFLDAALAQALSEQTDDPVAGALLGQLVATGTNRLNAAQVEALAAIGVRELVLCFDQDEAASAAPRLEQQGLQGQQGQQGQREQQERLSADPQSAIRNPQSAPKGRPEDAIAPVPSPQPLLSAGAAGTLATLDRLAEAGTFFPRVLRLPLELGCKDPDEVLTRHGPAVFAQLVAQRTVSEAEFRAEILLGPDRGAPEVRESVLAALAEFQEREAARPARALLVAEVVRRMALALGLETSALQAALQPFRRRAALKERARALREAALHVPAILLNGDDAAPDAEALARAEAALRAGLERAQDLAASDCAGEAPAPVDLTAYAGGLAARAELLVTPYHRLDEAAGIVPGRLTLIAARPSHGKTTFMLNLLVHWLKLHPERAFVFFSYDGPREQLLSQLVSRLTRRYGLNEVEAALRGETDDHPEAEALLARARAALRWLHDQGAERRLFIVDQPLNVQELSRVAQQLAASGPLGAIMVDYIQQVRPGRKFDTRQREVGYVSRALQALAQETGVPVLCAAQLNRVSESGTRTSRPRLWQLREAGDLEQDATTVYGLYNHHQAAQEENGSSDESGAAPASGPMAGGNGRRRGRDSTALAPHAAGGNGGNGAHALAAGHLGAKEAHGVAAAVARHDRSRSPWVAPNALRAVPLDVEVLKAKHGRAHVRVGLTYDLIANFITDGLTDGPTELAIGEEQK